MLWIDCLGLTGWIGDDWSHGWMLRVSQLNKPDYSPSNAVGISAGNSLGL